MAADNTSFVTEFILTGLTDQPGLQVPLFCLFLGFYVVTMVGNLSLITLIGLNTHLHIPMYFFLFNLSFIDFSYSSTISPKMLMGFVSKNIISYTGCMAQIFFYCFFVISECFILSAMAYDRYVAICKPLLYTNTMSPQVCLFLLLGVYGMGILGAVVHTKNMLILTFCTNNVVSHYMCDMLALFELSCNNSSYMNLLVVFIVVAIGISIPVGAIFLSYGFILSSIFHIQSIEGRSKAFSTCSSHIIVVCLFFGSGAFMYLKPPSVLPLNQGKVSSVFYTIVVPMLNPLIYSLRNKDVKLAVKKTLGRVHFS